MEPLSTNLRRIISFTRTKSEGGIFKRPVITFTLLREDGSELGQLSVHGQKASYTSPSSPQDEFKVKKNFWGTKWVHENSDEQEFGRFRYGFSLWPAFSLGGDARYHLRVKHPWPFRSRKLGKPSLTATVLEQDIPVLILQSFAKKPAFTSDVYAPLEGSISTSFESNRTVAACLLFFQTYIEARAHSAAH
jgi:hypothetical protein